ncbi:hypothetical protein LEP1GSC115_0999 [Leptospira interrogans serovar Australis str. 200703203]|uniref:Uncharacterized protein n=1 Tax=Leptospira interrogans serovar Australis str. 200703203 TaxID=1085541 RepID=N1UF35_LEPIR|nr:hypothetical protein LEP1GSC115_0999 [Leptospira interrogans serovar Australis str. 200703203]
MIATKKKIHFKVEFSDKNEIHKERKIRIHFLKFKTANLNVKRLVYKIVILSRRIRKLLHSINLILI